MFLGHVQGGIVVNGGFETGDFAGWTTSSLTDNSPYFAPVVNGTGVNSGSFAAHFGSGYGASDTLAQDLATVAGEQYTLTFSYGEYNANDPFAPFGYLNPANVSSDPNSPYYQTNDLVVNVNGNAVFHASNFLASDHGVTNAGDTWYAPQASVTFTATGSTTSIQFVGSDNQQDLVLDDVGATAPEPSTFILLFTGAGMVVLSNRRKLALLK